MVPFGSLEQPMHPRQNNCSKCKKQNTQDSKGNQLHETWLSRYFLKSNFTDSRLRTPLVQTLFYTQGN